MDIDDEMNDWHKKHQEDRSICSQCKYHNYSPFDEICFNCGWKNFEPKEE